MITPLVASNCVIYCICLVLSTYLTTYISICSYTVMVCIDDMSDAMCQGVLLAASSALCYWMNVYFSVHLLWPMQILYR